MILRIKYALTKDGTFLGHLDLLRTWQRSFRRADMPLAYSQGFNPRPKISFGSALAVGVTSSGEYLDVELTREVDCQKVIERLKVALPNALEVLEVKEIKDNKKSLMAIINRAKYEIQAELEEEIGEDDLLNFFKQEEILILKKNKRGIRQKDIKKGIFLLEFVKFKEKTYNFFLEVETGSQGNVRPEDVLKALEEFINIKIDILKIHRQGLYIFQDGNLKTPFQV